MKHFSHEHSLILNEVYDAKMGDMCYGCNEKIISCRLFVYSCIRASVTERSASTSDVHNNCLKFLLHKSCAELPLKIQNPKNQEEFLSLVSGRKYSGDRLTCIICNMPWNWSMYEKPGDFFVCVKCAMFQVQSLEDRKVEHPGHSQHPLTLVQHLSSFKCYACKVENDHIKDFSYICTKCPFLMHKNCADAPPCFKFQFHKHRLILSFSLQQVYQKFYQYCKLCNKMLSCLDWIYYCPNCRFFAHFNCARSNPMLRSSEYERYYSELVHLPAADESAVNLLFEQFVKALSSVKLHNDDGRRGEKGIKHWSHDEHELQVMSRNEVNDGKDDDDDASILVLCDGCVKPIRIDGGVLYGCVGCKYFLHKVCAELPRVIKHHLGRPGILGRTLSAHKYKKPYNSFYCYCCKYWCNGIYFFDALDHRKYDIGCVSLVPNIIKHEAHGHQLEKIEYTKGFCNACGNDEAGYMYRCERRCEYDICTTCIMKPRTHKHRWDRHPLQLIYDPAMVSDHEHEYNCEFCSQDIDTNKWFYHCSHCDLSFHIKDCFERSSYLNRSKIKFGATDIKIDQLHAHSLALVFNKKVRSCKLCGRKQLGEAVLECAPCKAIFCSDCCPLPEEIDSAELERMESAELGRMKTAELEMKTTREELEMMMARAELEIQNYIV